MSTNFFLLFLIFAKPAGVNDLNLYLFTMWSLSKTPTINEPAKPVQLCARKVMVRGSGNDDGGGVGRCDDCYINSYVCQRKRKFIHRYTNIQTFKQKGVHAYECM